MTLSELYRENARHVYRFSFWMSGNAADAEDITSETFVRALTRTQSFESATVRAYLFAIARNVFLQQRRRRRPRAELDEQLPDLAPDPYRRAKSSQEISRMSAALLALPEVDRTALLMRATEATPYRDIARSLDISVSAAKVKVHRARLRLAEALDRRIKDADHS